MDLLMKAGSGLNIFMILSILMIIISVGLIFIIIIQCRTIKKKKKNIPPKAYALKQISVQPKASSMTPVNIYHNPATIFQSNSTVGNDDDDDDGAYEVPVPVSRFQFAESDLDDDEDIIYDST